MPAVGFEETERLVCGGSALAERRLHFAKLLQFRVGQVLGGAVLGVGDILLGVLDFLGELRRVDVGERDRLSARMVRPLALTSAKPPRTKTRMGPLPWLMSTRRDAAST